MDAANVNAGIIIGRTLMEAAWSKVVIKAVKEICDGTDPVTETSLPSRRELNASFFTGMLLGIQSQLLENFERLSFKGFQ